jgi:hypothetical protein
MFLRQIEEISWASTNDESGEYFRSKPDWLDDGVRRVILLGQQAGQPDVEETWLIFSGDATTDAGVPVGQVEIAFRLESAGASSWRVRPTLNAHLVAFFPTVLTTHLGFVVQGPYRTTPSRDNVPRTDPWNQQLVKETSTLLVRSLRWLRDRSLLDIAALRCLPIDRSKFPDGSMFGPLYGAVAHALKSEALLPRYDGGYSAASNSRLARTQDLRDLFSPQQLASVLAVPGECDWLSADITAVRTPDLRQYLMGELGIDELEPDDILPKLSKNFLESQTDEWVRSLYEFLNRQPSLRRRAEGLPLVRLSNGSHTTSHSIEGPNAFLPGDHQTGFPTVRAAVCSTEESRAFLGSLGLTEPDPVDDVVRNILPGYTGDNSLERYNADLGRILAAYNSDSQAQRGKLLAALRRADFVRAVDTETGAVHWAKSGEVYIATERLKDLFRGVSGVLIVDDTESALQGEDVRSLLEACGASRYLRPLRAEPNWDKRRRLQEKAGSYGTRSVETIDDFTLLGVEALLDQLPSLSAEERSRRAKVLWQALVDVEQRQRNVFVGMYRGFYYGLARTCEFDTRIVELLNMVDWVPSADGQMVRPEFISFETLDWEANPFLQSVIRFKPAIIESLAREAGIEPGVLDLLKKLGVTSEAELRARLRLDDEASPSGNTERSGNHDSQPESPVSGDESDPSAPTRGASDSKRPHYGGPPEGQQKPERDTDRGSTGGTSVTNTDSDGNPSSDASERTFVSYVGVNAEDQQDDPDGLTYDARMALESKAIDLIIAREPRLRRTPAFNPGYDLFEIGERGEPVRWIEVKAMTGSLRNRPVGLSRAQFDFARQKGQEFWLYVVEGAGDPDAARVIRISDPIGKARTFTFDRGWVEVAEDSGSSVDDVNSDD